MDFWIFILCAAVVITGFPYIRCFFKRLKCVYKIKRLCRNKNYKIHATHPLWFLGSKHTKKCDLYIETANEVFAVKLFGMPKRFSILVLKENGEYFIRNFIALISSIGQGIRFPIDSKPKPMPVYDFRYKYRDEWEIKTPHNVLLVNPVSMEVRLQPNFGSEVIVGAGDVVNGMEIQSLSRFLGELERNL
jgi:hypothetical protein